MKKVKILFILAVCALLAGCAAPAADTGGGDYGCIRGELSALTPEAAGAYLAVVDELAGRLGFEEAEAAPGECLHGGFVRDWDGDGTPELCLVLKTSPRDADGTPLYGWFPPALALYTFRDGRAVPAGERDLYFATGGREAVAAVLPAGDGLRYVLWDCSALTQESMVVCFALTDGVLQETELPDEVTAALGAETARAFLEALGADKAQPLLYNNSGEARPEGPANARELREALAARAA